MIIDKFQKPKRKVETGFTLIELLTTVAVMSVIIAFAVPSFTQTLANQRVKSTISVIYNTLKDAKAHSYLTKTDTSVTYTPATGSTPATLTLKVPDPNSTDLSNPDILDLAKYELSSDVKIVSTPTNTVIFSNAGHASNGAVFTICDASLADSHSKKQVTVNTVTNISITTTGDVNDCV